MRCQAVLFIQGMPCTIYNDKGKILGDTLLQYSPLHHLSYLPRWHRASAILRHSLWLTATWQASSQLSNPNSSLHSFSAIFHQVILVLPTCLLPMGSQLIAILGLSPGCILRTWSIHWHCLFLTFLLTEGTPDLLYSSLFEMCSGHHTPKIHLRNLFWNVSSILFFSFNLLKTISATLFTKSFVHHVNEITSAKLKDHLAPEEKNISEVQNNVLQVPTLQNMNGLLTK